MQRPCWGDACTLFKKITFCNSLLVCALSCGVQNNYMITYESDSDSVVANRQCSNEEPCKDTFDDISEGVDYIVSVTGFEAANPVKVMCELCTYM